MALILLTSAGALLLLALLLTLRHRERHAREQLAQYRALVESLPEGLLLVGRDGRIRQHNQAASRLLAGGEQHLIGSPLEDWLPHSKATEPSDSQHSLAISRLTPAGAQDAVVRIQPAAGQDETAQDVERFKRSQYFARIGTWDWQIGTDELYWSDAIYGMFGYQMGEVAPSYELFCARVHPQDLARVRAGELRCIETGENHDEEYRVIWPDGSVRWLRETGNVLKDGDGKTVRMMGVVRDITEEKNWANELHVLAHHDALTGLPNRLVFETQLAKAIERARRNMTRVALVFIDLNGFKAINDLYGHAAGDKVLQETGARLGEALRESDTIARIGGDEFVAILEAVPLDRTLEQETEIIARKILGALAPPIQIDDSPQRVGASLGIAVFPDHASSMDKLIHIADLAMYAAKRSGNNQYRLGSHLAHVPSAND